MRQGDRTCGHPQEGRHQLAGQRCNLDCRRANAMIDDDLDALGLRTGLVPAASPQWLRSALAEREKSKQAGHDQTVVVAILLAGASLAPVLRSADECSRWAQAYGSQWRTGDQLEFLPD